ncbi:O-antigen ligase family protein [bacterium]|nr:O-antigen ligase family protein [bacterium]MBU4123254.1 O-antigen ligase family protein [bacterium]
MAIFVKILFFLIPVAALPFLNDSFALPKAILLWMFIPLFFAADSFAADREESPVYFLTVLYFMLSLFSIYPALSFTGLYRYYFSGLFSLLAGVALFRILRNFPQAAVKKQLGFLLFSALLTCAAVFAGGGGRISSTFGNPNFYGGALAAVSPYALYFSISKPGYIIHFMFFAIALLMTHSRASWVGVSAGIIFFIFCAGKKHGLSVMKRAAAPKAADLKAARNVLAALALIIAGAFISSPRFSGDIVRRAVSIFDLSEADIVSRFEGYAASLAMFADKPLFGHGPESFSILFRSHAPVSFIRQTGGLAHAGYSHCWPLQILTETGLAGFGAWFLLIFVLIKKAIASKELFKKAAGASVIAYAVTNLFAFPSITELLIFWFSAAVIYGPRQVPPLAGNIFTRKGRLFAAAASFLILLAPLVSEIFFVKAVKSPDNEKAYALFRRAAFFLPADYHLMNAGKRCILIYNNTNLPLWLDRGDYFFEKLAKKNPRHALALNGLGVSAREKLELYKDKKYAGIAETFFKKAIENDPYLKAARLNLALLLEKEGRFAQALGQYEQALEIYRDDQQMLFNSGVVSVNAGNPKKALEFWYRLREINPGYGKLGEYIKQAEAL